MEPNLQKQLGALESIRRRTGRSRKLAVFWLVATAICLLFILVQRIIGWKSPLFWMPPLLGGFIGALMIWLRERRCPIDFRSLVAAIEHEHPELHHLLSTAIEQKPDDATGEFGFLQLRVIEEVRRHRHRVLWEQELRKKLFSAKNRNAIAFAAFVLSLWFGYNSAHWKPTARGAWFAQEIEVTPGDTELERGSGLVISARFGGKPPTEATLVLVSASGKTKRVPLARNLSDPVFGASLLDISENSFYRVEYSGKKSPDYKISVFDFPALTRADAQLEFPGYTGLTNKTIPDTRRISAVEGTKLNYTLQLNKPIARARLVSPERALTLTVQSNAVASLDNVILTNSARYTLELVDADGRTNKFPTEFSLQALTNRRPDLKLAFPRGDQRVSRLEELQLQAEASDDFGLVKYGIGFGVAGEEGKFLELGAAAPANEKRQFNHLIPLEKLGVEIDQVVSYFAWADDYGPDGKVRRTFGDVFFAEIRPFEEIFRRDQSGGGGESGQQGQQGNQNTKLAELQKQIVIATWKLQREKELPAEKKNGELNFQ